jgi:4-oxalocrotonate tautomerase
MRKRAVLRGPRNRSRNDRKVRLMPLIEVKAVDRRFEDPAMNERLIATLTDAACQVFGEDARSQIWVVLEGVPASRWGIGGKSLS